MASYLWEVCLFGVKFNGTYIHSLRVAESYNRVSFLIELIWIGREALKETPYI